MIFVEEYIKGDKDAFKLLVQLVKIQNLLELELSKQTGRGPLVRVLVV